MILRPELAKKIRAGLKSQHRQPVRYDVDGRTASCVYETEHSYAVQPGFGKLSICRITITDIRNEPLGELTLRDALREGFKTRDEFYQHWQTLHHRLDLNEQVWVITFNLGDQTDQPRLLAARPGAPHGDYVTNPHHAMPDEPEAISAGDVERFGKLAHARDHDRREEPLRAQRDQLAGVLAEMRGVLDRAPNEAVSSTVRRLERELQVLNRKLAA